MSVALMLIHAIHSLTVSRRAFPLIMRGLHAFFSHMFAGQGLVAAAAAQAAPSGGVTPTAPGPNDVFNEGANCTFSWTPDPSGVWKQTDVELMTGDNFNMVFLTST